MNNLNLRRLLCLLILLVGVMGAEDSFAQKKKKKKKKGEETTVTTPPKPKEDKKSIAYLTKKSKKMDGLFTIYQDTTTGSLRMAISEDQLNKEFIYFSQVSDGVPDAGQFRGAYGQEVVFHIEKYFDRLEFVVPNRSSYFDPDNALAKAADANISDAIIASVKFETYDKKEKKYLIKADNLFLKETLRQVKPPRFPGGSPFAFSLGNLDPSKTKIKAIRNYEKNTDLAIEYVYSKGSVLNGGSRAVTDGRSVAIKVYHTMLAMPEGDYQIRYDDSRVGYFTTQQTDMTTTESTPYLDKIHRWKLVKKDPNAAISEPVEPIVFWIENTTPREIRDVIKTAALTWNEAFEGAGFRNAMVINEMPDDAEWDAGDIRYNVIRWTASTSSFFSGYGPSFVNPKTGQILGADIMLEYSSLSNNLSNGKLFDKAGLDMIALGEEDEVPNFLGDYFTCDAIELAHLNQVFGTMALNVMGAPEVEKTKMINEFLHYLVIHELGHTLGLSHNMMSSQLYGIDEIHNESITSKTGLIGSIMDYPSINFAPEGTPQGQYYSTKPGPYDMWAIEFGYKDMNDSEREALLNKSTQPELAFGNDADDMRAPGRGYDPRINVGDLTSDAIDYAIDRIKLTKSLGENILTKYEEKDGKSYNDLLTQYYVLSGQQASAATTVSRYIGGVYMDRGRVGQPGESQPFTPVDEATQKKAMKVLSDHINSANAFEFPAELCNHNASQRRGFAVSPTPRISSRILGIQRGILAHLTHPNTLLRISDSEMYGNTYSQAEMMADLTKAVFGSDLSRNVNNQRQNLQIAYTKTLIGMISGRTSQRYVHTSQSLALYNLKNIRKMATNQAGNTASRAHKEHLRTLIDQALDD